MATRLSEDPSVRVGVLEAGETAKNVDIIDVPGLVCGHTNSENLS